MNAILAALLVFSFSNDHTNLLYRCGETASFHVKVAQTDGSAPTNGTLAAVLDNFGPKKIAKAKPLFSRPSANEPVISERSNSV